eukprot:scaffold55757_cov54-Phaeocystis_antarctica.AAC.1
MASSCAAWCFSMATNSAEDGSVTAPTRSSTQKAMRHLSRKGRTTCRHRPCGEMIGMGAREGPERAKGGA